MDETIRKPDLPSNDQRTAVPQDVTSTIRVDNPQSSSANGDITVRPGATATNDKNGATDFVLKGRVFRCIKCISDNSGEAQVFLVSSDEGEMVLKIYYPNFTIKKTLMRIIQNFNLEMIVKIVDYGKTYVDGKNRAELLSKLFADRSAAGTELSSDCDNVLFHTLTILYNVCYIYNTTKYADVHYNFVTFIHFFASLFTNAISYGIKVFASEYSDKNPLFIGTFDTGRFGCIFRQD